MEETTEAGARFTSLESIVEGLEVEMTDFIDAEVGK
jgi:hypothetical protein